MDELEKYLDVAASWLFKKRKNYHHNSDSIILWVDWESKRTEMLESLQNGTYRFSERKKMIIKGEHKILFEPQDTIVLKAISLILKPIIKEKIPNSCFHVKGNGGLKGAVKFVCSNRKEYKYMVRSDIKDFYSSMNHDVILSQIKKYTSEPLLLDLIEQSVRGVECWDRIYFTIHKGIPYGSPLSPILAAIALEPLDQVMENRKGLAYVRFMDDWVILTKTRFQLRKAIKCMYKAIEPLKFKIHPKKTLIGLIEKGFSFLGYYFSTELFCLAQETTDRACNKLQKLYEQHVKSTSVTEYITRFNRWVWSGLADTGLVYTALTKPFYAAPQQY
ncbi:MAG: RNA-directed DNA polymerase [Chlamydiales bacterium]